MEKNINTLSKINKYIHVIGIMALSMLVLACPPTADDGSSSSNPSNSNGSGDTQKLLYYSNQAFNHGVDGVDGLRNLTSVTVSPDGKNVYVTGFDDHSVAVFSRNTSTGLLAFEQVIKDNDPITGGNLDGLLRAISVAVSPDGKNVYVTGQGDKAVVVFNRDATDKGKLTFVEVIKDGDAITGGGNVDGLDAASGVTVSPDNSNVYVAGWADKAVAVFSRDTTNGTDKGKLTFVEVIKDNDPITGGGNVDGLDGAFSVTVSLNNNNVYVASRVDKAVVVFNRNANDNGKLSYSAKFKNGEGSVDGLDEANAVVVSPDGKNVYATGSLSHAVVVFNRDTGTGALTYSTRLKDGENGVDELLGARSVVVSPDGKYVYVSGFHDNTVTLFTRDTSTGALTLYEVFKYGTRGFNAGTLGVGNLLITSIAVSPDGNNVYMGSDYNALGVFEWR